MTQQRMSLKSVREQINSVTQQQINSVLSHTVKLCRTQAIMLFGTLDCLHSGCFNQWNLPLRKPKAFFMTRLVC